MKKDEIIHLVFGQKNKTKLGNDWKNISTIEFIIIFFPFHVQFTCNTDLQIKRIVLNYFNKKMLFVSLFENLITRVYIYILYT